MTILQPVFLIPEKTAISEMRGINVQQLVSRWQGKLRSVSADVFLLCLVLLLAATVLLPSGAAGMEDCESSESGQELLPVLFHAMRFTSCGGTETHNGWSTDKHTHTHTCVDGQQTG